MRWRYCLKYSALIGLVVVAGCAQPAVNPSPSAVGPRPVLPAPQSSLIPTVRTAKPVGWGADETPQAASGLTVKAFARGLDHPRWLYVLPNGDVIVAETNAPAKSPGAGGLRGFVASLVMSGAGAGVRSPDRITLLRDTNGDGEADVRSVLLSGLHSPFGMALAGDRLYVANADSIRSFPYSPGVLSIDDPGRHVADLPGGPINHHWTKNILATPDGRALYATVGSNSNIGENGLNNEQGRAAVWKVDIESGAGMLFATGLRNPNGLAFEPETGRLWTTVNERDELGPDLPPDYMTSLTEGAFYGWPYSYFGKNVDDRVRPARPDLVATAVEPDYALGAHTASLGLAFAPGGGLGEAFANGAFVGQHGSWNRSPPSGYRVVFIPFSEGRPSGAMVDVLTGFLNERNEARGRPAGVSFGKDGALLVADDVGNVVWRVSRAGP
ncbi:MAG: sorbosone dehydrogenase family protein [Alphaproteobacteria bacterium]|nr:sorbosone dehydrogenase family protein [Alphaproteobacteria bacterium]